MRACAKGRLSNRLNYVRSVTTRNQLPPAFSRFLVALELTKECPDRAEVSANPG